MKQPENHQHTPHRPAVAIALLGATALVAATAVVINLGGDALFAIAATLTIASALTLIVFQVTRGRRR